MKVMKDVTEIERVKIDNVEKLQRATKLIMLTVGMVTMLQSGLVFEKEGYAMIKDEEDKDIRITKCVGSLIHEIREGLVINEEQVVNALSTQNTENLNDLLEYRKYSSYTMKELIDYCLHQITTKSYNRTEIEANYYKMFIMIVVSLFDKLEQDQQLILECTMMDILQELTY